METKNDPVLELADGWKKVMYFGHELIVPDWVNWISIDKGGHAFGYDWQPRQLDFEWRSFGGVKFLLSFNSSGFDWRETLREV